MTCGLQNRATTTQPIENEGVTGGHAGDSPETPPTAFDAGDTQYASTLFHKALEPAHLGADGWGPDQALRIPPDRWTNFEDHRVRDMRVPRWHTLPVWSNEPNFELLFQFDDGLTLYGTLLVLVRLAFMGRVRGALVNTDGSSLNADQITFLTRTQAQVLMPCIRRLIDLGWLEVVEWPPAEDAESTPVTSVAEPRRESRRAASQGSTSIAHPLDNAMIRRNGLPFHAQSQPTQSKLNKFIEQYNVELVEQALNDNAMGTGVEGTIQGALNKMAFELAGRQKRAANAKHQAAPEFSDAPDW